MSHNLLPILNIQRTAWNSGHPNYGASIDVLSEALRVLSGFKHLNPVQKLLFNDLSHNDSLKYAKPLCSGARKATRHFIVTLK